MICLTILDIFYVCHAIQIINNYMCNVCKVLNNYVNIDASTKCIPSLWFIVLCITASILIMFYQR